MLIELLKKVPIDLGQGNLRYTTEGKRIAMEHVPRASAGAKALDVGCREGHQSRWLEQMGYTVTSMDVEKLYDGAHVIDANHPLPWADETFDLVWCSEVIEHLDDPVRSLAEMRRVVKPGGMLIMTTPNSFAWFYRIFNLLGFPPAKLQHPGHKYFFCLDDIQALFPRAQVLGYFPYSIVKRTISSGLGLLTPTFVMVEKK